MNSYFASVEQQANPFLRGRPVGVCAYLHESGCVIAASIEAKRMGMKVGMSVAEAREKVPSAVFVQNDPGKYREVTSKLFSFLHELSDTVEHYSIDEAFVDLTGFCRDAAEAAFLCSRVKYRIQKEIGEWLCCSVGIAPTRFLAKFGSDRKKPDGLVVIDESNLDEYLSRANLEDLCGIGPRIRKRLLHIGIRTPLDLKKYPVGNLMRALGKNGFFWWCKLHAIECEQILEGSPLPKSVGHSYCVPNHVNRDGTVEAVLTKLTERAARRLRSYGLLAGAVSISVGFRASGEYQGNWMRFGEPVDDSFSSTRMVTRLLHTMWQGEPVNFLAVTFFELGLPNGQLSFGMYGQSLASYREEAVGEARYAMRDRRERAVSDSVDLIRDRYGSESILLGRMFPVQGGKEAPDRIGFRKTVTADPRWGLRNEPIVTLDPS